MAFSVFTARVGVAICAGAIVAGATGLLTAQQPAAPAPASQTPPCGGRSSNPQTACPGDVSAMMAALPDKAPAKPKQPRKILVLAKAAGWVHSSIPLAARTVEELGKKTGAWTATTTYDPADINTENLKQYDAIFLDNTTGAFLDDPNDAAATEARKKALLEFIRSGKGIAALHAAGDSYHASSGAARGAEPPPAPGAPKPVPQGRDDQVGTWPEYDKIIGGFFKFHWNDPQEITYKIDDPASPLTAMFKGGPFVIHDETYTFGMDTYSRENLHILTSIDYSKMSDADKAKEANPRSDHDYALSWIRPEGKGRLFYMAHGHHERNYAVRPLLEHLLAGVQYALGDLPADDSPSVKPGTK